jgi:hypothetical protein
MSHTPVSRKNNTVERLENIVFPGAHYLRTIEKTVGKTLENPQFSVLKTKKKEN